MPIFISSAPASSGLSAEALQSSFFSFILFPSKRRFFWRSKVVILERKVSYEHFRNWIAWIILFFNTLSMVPICSLTLNISKNIGRISKGFANSIIISFSIKLYSMLYSLVVFSHFLIHIKYVLFHFHLWLRFLSQSFLTFFVLLFFVVL